MMSFNSNTSNMESNESEVYGSVTDVSKQNQGDSGAKIDRLQEELGVLMRIVTDQQEVMRDLAQAKDQEKEESSSRGTSNVTLRAEPTGLGKIPKLPTFSGKVKDDGCGFEQWIYEVESLRGLVTDVVLRRAITLSLKGQAHAAIRNMDPCSTVGDMILKLKSQFGATIDPTLKMQELLQIKQGKSETVANYLARLEDCYFQLKKAGGALGLGSGEDNAYKDLFLGGLRMSLSQKLYYLKHSGDKFRLEEIFSLAKLAEEEENQSSKRDSATVVQGKSVSAQSTENACTSALEGVQKQLDKISAELGKLKAGKGKSKVPRCYHCNEEGHIKPKCPALQGSRGNKPQGNEVGKTQGAGVPSQI